MKPHDLMQLLGGFAAGTLTSEEREALFRVALEDQALFDALADEEALRELLADPVARARLLGDLAEAPRDFWSRFAGWLRKPATLALAGTAAALLLVVGTVRYTQRETQAPKLIAQAPRLAEPATPAAAVPRPAAKPMRREAPATVSDRQIAPPASVPLQQGDAEAPNAVQRSEAMPASSAARPAAAPALAQKRADAARPAPPVSAVVLRQVDGAWREIPAATAFREGDQVRLRVRAAEDGYVLVTVQDGPGVLSLGPPLAMPVKAGQDLVVPPAGALTLAGISGEKLLRLSFSTQAAAAPELGMQFARGAGAPAAKTAAEVSPPPGQIEIRLLYRPQ